MSSDADLKELLNLLHPQASTPDGPAAPWVRKAAEQMVLSSMQSKTTGWIMGGFCAPSTMKIFRCHTAHGMLSL